MIASIADILMILSNVLQPWAAANNAGTAVIAASVTDMWTQAYTSTDKSSVIIAFVGDEARGPFELAAATHRGDFTFNVMLISGRGLTANRGDSLVTSVQNATAFYTLLESLRDKIRSITNISVEQFVDYKSSRIAEDMVNQYNRRINAYLLEFSVAQDYPQLVNTPQNTIIPI